MVFLECERRYVEIASKLIMVWIYRSLCFTVQERFRNDPEFVLYYSCLLWTNYTRTSENGN